jgi:hypothetical protein
MIWSIIYLSVYLSLYVYFCLSVVTTHYYVIITQNQVTQKKIIIITQHLPYCLSVRLCGAFSVNFYANSVDSLSLYSLYSYSVIRLILIQ